MNNKYRTAKTTGLVLVLAGAVFLVSRQITPPPEGPPIQVKPPDATQVAKIGAQREEKQKIEQRTELANRGKKAAETKHHTLVKNPDITDITTTYFSTHKDGIDGAKQTVAETDKLRLAYNRQQQKLTAEKGNLGPAHLVKPMQAPIADPAQAPAPAPR